MIGWTAIVPIKPVGRRKTRLAGALDAPAIAALTEAMLGHVLGALDRAPAIGQVRLLARDPPADPARAWLRDPGGGLNAALRAAAGQVSTGLVVVHADLPGLTPDDAAALVEAAAHGVAIAPDAAGRGTNAIALRDPAVAGFAFGPDSFARHRALHPAAAIVRRPGLALDVDRPADLHAAARRGWLVPVANGRRTAPAPR